MILRAMGLGFLVWLAATLAFRFAGQQFFVPDDTWLAVLFAATIPAMALLTVVAVRLLRVARGDEAEAAIGLAVPGMLLDVYATAEFQEVFPNLDYMLGQTFGALLLLAYATVLVTGLVMTRLAPKDERVG